MKGNVYANGNCPNCGGKFQHDENRDGCFCLNCDYEAIRGFRTKYGSDILIRFDKYSDARDSLNGLRWKEREGTLDTRDYKAGNPLGFENQVSRYLNIKEKEYNSVNTYRNIKRDLIKAVHVWGQRNIKTIGYAEIEDFLYGLTKKDGTAVSDKTRSNTKSVLSDFWSWVVKREKQSQAKIDMPEFPKCEFVLGWREIISIEDQQAIIEEVKRISYHINPKIWIGIKWLATYISIRPGEIIKLDEKHINVDGLFVIPDNKEKDPKLIPMTDEDIELYQEIFKQFPALPYMPFFRHVKNHRGTKVGKRFGRDYIYNWWKKACDNLGVKDVDLYGGTKHSTTTALGEYFSDKELMEYGTTHKSNKAFQRYMQAEKKASRKIYEKVQELTGKKGNVTKIKIDNK